MRFRFLGLIPLSHDAFYGATLAAVLAWIPVGVFAGPRIGHPNLVLVVIGLIWIFLITSSHLYFRCVQCNAYLGDRRHLKFGVQRCWSCGANLKDTSPPG